MRTILILGALLLPGAQAWGQTCSAAATGEAFGTYNPFAPTATTSTATLSVTCQNAVAILVSYTVALGGGGSGAVAARSMSNGSFTLAYQLYRDAAHSQVWGDGTGGSLTLTDGYTLGLLVPVTRIYAAYGVIPAGLRVGAGIYGDTVTILITY